MALKKSAAHHHHGLHLQVYSDTTLGKTLSRREKLVIRLDRYVQHSLEHAGLLERMAEEAEGCQEMETARLIRTAEKNLFLQNRSLEKAALILKSETEKKPPGKKSPAAPALVDPVSRRSGGCGKKRKKC
jgi:hypothetical protein